MKRALITGITGQDGSHLADYLLAKGGYQVHGIVRRSSSFNTGRIDHIFNRLTLHHADLTDASSLARVMNAVRPDEVYNLGAQSHVKVSFDEPVFTMNTVAIGTLNMLEAVKSYQESHGIARDVVRFYQAGSSEMFGSAPAPQSESTSFHPRSPYGVAKVAAHHMAVNYREAYGMWVSNGILFNHEGPRRGETFVTRKITRAAARIKLGLQDVLLLGNMNATRDWGYAGDYVEAMWLMLQHHKPDDFVIATGKPFAVTDFVATAFAKLGLSVTKHVVIDPRYKRPAEVDVLCGDASKARRELRWSPSHSLAQLIDMMLEHDLELARRELAAGGRTP